MLDYGLNLGKNVDEMNYMNDQANQLLTLNNQFFKSQMEVLIFSHYKSLRDYPSQFKTQPRDGRPRTNKISDGFAKIGYASQIFLVCDFSIFFP